ncbi:hypothetical protein [Aquibacillus albus]|uniref:Transposase YdaD n=1 Tax=Aquibacillus albus TaxID=1168171 RepID=A0ABS2N3I3_9BACI|nr:hypothetical protein [Aquibacillus albus]MBM7572658.1 putative transposase YdaD [Aquibacillus albus]
MVYVDRDNLPQSWAELERVFREEGKEEGKEESERSVARRMLKDGMSVELVAKYVTLSKEKIQKLADEL